MTADKIFINGHILTQDPEHPRAEQLALKAGRIMSLGDDLSTLQNDSTEIIDLKGSMLTPGFIDAHLHLLWGGQGLLSIPIQDARSKSEFIRIIQEQAQGKEPGDWIQGNGWNENLLAEQMLPQKDWLDEAAPGSPVLLIRHDGHSAVASSEALRFAGIEKDTPDPIGGVIDRNERGEATGILRDAAIGLVDRHIPKNSRAQLLEYFEAAQDYLLGNGVTTICDMIYDMDHFLFLQHMAKAGKLRIRITAYLPLLKWPEIKALLAEGVYEDEWLQLKGLKGFCDGSLGSHTALMLDPYDDTPDSSGIYDPDWEDTDLVKTIIEEADQAGLQVVIHAIGDRANREVLDIFEGVIQKNGERDRRFRIEHAQHVHPLDQPRFKQLEVIASMQPAHCVDDSLYAEKLLGERCRYAYPYRSLLAEGVRLSLGSDWPVSPADPILSIHSALHRNGWVMEEAMAFDQALPGHFGDAAYSIFREGELGSLRPGALADLVILKPDFFQLPSREQLPAPMIQSVYVNGEEVR